MNDLQVVLDSDLQQQFKLVLDEQKWVTESFFIDSDEQRDNAIEFLRNTKINFNFFEEKRKEIKAPYLNASKEVDSRFKEILDPLNKGIETLTKAINAYQSKLIEEKKALEAKAMREAQEAAAKERAKLQAQAEKAEASGNIEKAELLKDQAQSVHAQANLPTQDIKMSGAHMRPTVIAVIVDIKKIPPEIYLNSPGVIAEIQKVLNTLAKNKVPVEGVEYKEQFTTVIRTK